MRALRLQLPFQIPWPWWAWPRPRRRRKMDLEVCNQAQPGPVGNLAKLGVLMFKVSLLPTLNVSTPSGCFGEAVCHPTRAPVQHRSSASACVPTFDPRLYSWKVRNESRIYIYKHILIRYVYSIDHVTCSTYVCIHTYIYLDIHLNLNMGYPPNNFHWMIMMKLRSAGRDVPWSLMTFLCA